MRSVSVALICCVCISLIRQKKEKNIKNFTRSKKKCILLLVRDIFADNEDYVN